MNERKFGGRTNAYLLMTAKWVLPGRKTKESDAILFEEVFDVKKKISFVGWFNVLYHIMNKYEVVAFILRLRLFCKEKILTNKRALLMAFCEESLCFNDSTLTDVYSSHLTTLFCEGKQIAALATANFQHRSLPQKE